ncbi:MAG: hypothetical protein LBT89_04025 [Planctomycetaceae bacterium]|jgi:uncharacterized short protein YbdD (DUF466 family)|nr:hypothetical protein [Planctomycetaceae bacterium]
MNDTALDTVQQENRNHNPDTLDIIRDHLVEKAREDVETGSLKSDSERQDAEENNESSPNRRCFSADMKKALVQDREQKDIAKAQDKLQRDIAKAEAEFQDRVQKAKAKAQDRGQKAKAEAEAEFVDSVQKTEAEFQDSGQDAKAVAEKFARFNKHLSALIKHLSAIPDVSEKTLFAF